MERIKNEHIKEIMGVNGKPDIIDIIQTERLQWYGQVKRMTEERMLKLILEWIPQKRRKRGRPKGSHSIIYMVIMPNSDTVLISDSRMLGM
jgi:hypothetical protein